MKLTRAEKKSLAKKKPTKKGKTFNVIQILKLNYIYLSILTAITILVYANSINNEFSVIDDLSTIVNNARLLSFSETLSGFNLQLIIYSGIINTFSVSAIPFNILSLILHIFVVILSFTTIHLLFNKKVAMISSLLFAVHPVTTEVVNWISASAYLYHSLFGYLSILTYVGYKITNRKLYLVFTFIIYSVNLLIFPNPWVLVIPLALIVIDQFFYNTKINLKSLLPITLLIIPIVILYFAPLQESYGIRTQYRTESGGKSLVNQQSLKPVIESYPYTTYSLSRLYLFPKDLTTYYDGKPVSDGKYLLMYIAFFAYIGLIIYMWKKNRKVSGLLILLIVLIAPTFSPKKITWFITERYMYFGTAAFTTLIALFFIHLENRFKIKKLSIYLTLTLLIAYSLRTFIRNNDWQNPETLALSTIKVAPLSVRPYNDIAGYYVIENRIPEAIDYYNKALEVEPKSTTAINNLGYIFINEGLPKRGKYVISDIDDMKFKEYYDLAKQYISNKEDQKALYYLSKARKSDPGSMGTAYLAGQIFSRAGNTDNARKEFEWILAQDPSHTEAIYEMGYIEFLDGNIEKSKGLLIQVLEINPEHTGAAENLRYIQSLEE